MAEEVHITAQEDRERRYKAELRRLKAILKTADANKLKAAKSLIENAAFHAILLEDLQATITKTGTEIDYQNGENQKGKTEAPALKSLTATTKNHLAIMKELLDMVPPAPKKPRRLDGLRNA